MNQINLNNNYRKKSNLKPQETRYIIMSIFNVDKKSSSLWMRELFPIKIFRNNNNNFNENNTA